MHNFNIIESALDFDRFRAWLARHDPDDVVGQVGRSADCPLARYLNEFLLEAFLPNKVRVYTGRIAIACPGIPWDEWPWIRLPPVFSAFVFMVDTNWVITGNKFCITAAQARSCAELAADLVNVEPEAAAPEEQREAVLV